MSPTGSGRGRTGGGDDRRRGGRPTTGGSSGGRSGGARSTGGRSTGGRGTGGRSAGSGGTGSRGAGAGAGRGDGRTGGTGGGAGRGAGRTGRSGATRSTAPHHEPSRAGGSAAGAEQVEGRQAVRELLRAGRRRVRQLHVADGSDPAGPVGEILDLAEAAGVAVRWLPRDRIDAMAATDAPQGVIAAAEPLPERTLDQLIAGPADGPAPFLVVLDGVTDPHNLGAVMRSALCAGATGLVVGRHRSASLTPAAVKAAAGAVEYLPVAAVAGVAAALSELTAAGVWTVGLDAGADADIWTMAVASEPVALVLGAEGRGLSPLVRRRCDLVTGIPMSGPLDSLNVSAAAALACFEVARRRTGR